MADGLSLRHRRAVRRFGLTATVLGVHLWLLQGAADHLARTAHLPPMPPRLQVSYVRDMALMPALPPRFVAAMAPVMPRTQRVPGPRPARQATDRALLPPLQTTLAEAAVAEAAAPDPSSAAASTPVEEPAAEPLTASAAPPSEGPEAAPEAPPAPAGPADGVLASDTHFTWPESTRLSYRLTGHYLSEVHGRAQVEWVLAGPRYQVNLDVTVGLSFAPLFSRQMRSEGSLGPQGLQPEQYEETSRLAFRDRRLARLQLDPGGVLLAQGERWTPPMGLTPPGAPGGPMAVQDSASQFVQLTYLFTRQPQLLATGHSIALLLALPGRVVPWVYEVVGPETLYTDFGPVESLHVRPAPDTPRGNDLLAEAWFAPGLANLPVRIRIEQAQGVFIDLLLERRPELAAAPARPPAPDRPDPP